MIFMVSDVVLVCIFVETRWWLSHQPFRVWPTLWLSTPIKAQGEWAWVFQCRTVERLGFWRTKYWWNLWSWLWTNSLTELIQSSRLSYRVIFINSSYIFFVALQAWHRPSHSLHPRSSHSLVCASVYTYTSTLLQFYFLHLSTATSCLRCHHLPQAIRSRAGTCLKKLQLLFSNKLLLTLWWSTSRQFIPRFPWRDFRNPRYLPDAD